MTTLGIAIMTLLELGLLWQVAGNGSLVALAVLVMLVGLHTRVIVRESARITLDELRIIEARVRIVEGHGLG